MQMELKPCQDCSQQISSRAAFCPHCGCPCHENFRQAVVVADFNIGIGNLIALFIKAALAFIPAAIILITLGAIIVAIFQTKFH